MSVKDSFLVKLLLTVGSLLLFLILTECGFRIINSRLVSLNWTERPQMYYLPESTVDNRDFFYTPEKAENVFRIISIGDSFTFSGKMQFDDCYPKRLERMLNLNNNQRKVEVLNWGVPGYSTFQEATFVDKAIKYYHPDLIILEVTLNDPELQPYSVTHRNQFSVEQTIQNYPIFSHWKSLGFVMARILNTIRHREYNQYYFDLYNNPNTWGNFSGSIKNITRLTSNNKVPILAVVFPLFNDRLDNKYPFAWIHQKIKDFFAQVSLPELDLLPFFSNIPSERLQVIPGEDSHPNETAQRIAASAIYDTLAQNQLIPADLKIKKISTLSPFTFETIWC